MTSRRRSALVDSLEPRQLLTAVFPTAAAQPAGALTGRLVYLSAGHGFAANASGLWSTGRGVTNGIVEDMGTQDQLTYYADAAWRAGATVVPFRPVGHQTNEAIVDNLSATYTGAWNDTTNTTLPYYSTTNGSGVRYRTAPTSSTETAVATFTPNLTAAGFYPVYAWAADATDRSADQLYRVNHSGGATEVRVNHQRVGKGWVYLGTYSFDAGTAGNVQVSNKSTANASGRFVVADAIRFGNGRGDVARNGHTSGQSREDEAALYWVEAERGWTAANARVSMSAFRGSSTLDSDANVGAPLKYAAYMNAAPFGQSVYLSFHSNASGGTGTQSPRGTEGLYNDASLFPGTATKNQKAWASLVGNEITRDLVAYGSPPLEAAWYDNASPIYARTDYAFGEIRADSSGNEFDATIVEVAYHDNSIDAALMKDPDVRARIAQSSVQATAKYFNQFGGAAAPAFTPDAPGGLRTQLDASGNVRLNWDAPTTTTYGGAPTGYRVYASRDGYGFDGGRLVTGTTMFISGSEVGTDAAYFKVVAVNAGGESPASQVAALRRGDRSLGRVLIVNGFDRLDRTQDVVESLPIAGTNDVTPGTGVAVTRVRPREGNSFDYAVQHGQAIVASTANLGFDTAENEEIANGTVNLAGYRAVIWISGEESTADHTFTAAEQARVTSYVNAGGRLMVSGSEVGYDLVGNNNGASFFNNTLHSGYVRDSAATHSAGGVSGSIFSGLSIAFGYDATSYNVDFPDVLSAVGTGASVVLNYVGGTGGAAAIAWSGSNGARVLMSGFGFETITTAAGRKGFMKGTLGLFGFATV